MLRAKPHQAPWLFVSLVCWWVFLVRSDAGVPVLRWPNKLGRMGGRRRRGLLERGRVRSLAIPGAGRRTPRAERTVILIAVQSMRLDGSERFPPSLPGRCLVVVLDRSLDTTGWYGCGSWRRADDWADVFDTGAFASSRVTSPNNCSRRTPLSCARRSCTFSLTPRRITVPSSRTRARPARPSSCR